MIKVAELEDGKSLQQYDFMLFLNSELIIPIMVVEVGCLHVHGQNIA